MLIPDSINNQSVYHRNWVRADLSKSELHVLEQVIHCSESLLLVPPKYSERELFIPDVPSEDVHIGLFSSGTTGDPKCMWVSRDKLVLNAKMSAMSFGVHSGNKIFILASPWHIAGLSWALMAFQEGITFEIRTPYQSLTPEFISKLDDENFTHLFTTPFTYRQLVQDGNWFVEEIICGGSAFTAEDLKFFPKHASFMTSGYGMTEAGGIISAYRSSSSLWNRNQLGCVGSAVEQVRIRCNGTSNQPGPIYLHSPTAVCEGWLDTGDFGYKDENNHLFITHRKKDSINGKIEK